MDSLNRRSFLKGAAMGLALAGGGSTVFTACGSDSKGSNPADKEAFGALNWQLAWIKDAQFGGSYIADNKGYYRSNGFESVNFIAGGPTVVPVPVVVSGKAFVTLAAAEQVASAILQGADVVTIATLYQKNAMGLMSLAKSPITKPEDMAGKRIGVQTTNTGIFAAFLASNDMKPEDVKSVPVQFDPAPLTNGDVDGLLCLVTRQPVALELQGYKTNSWLFSDFNYPKMDGLYVVTKDTLAKHRDKVKAVLKSEIQGWRDQVRDPSIGAQLAVEKYGSDLGLNIKSELATATAQKPLMLTDRTKTEGLLSNTAELREQTVASLALGGLDLPADRMFDPSVLDEVYAENPELRQV
ncbi:ABC transporter substrate-binding protein [Kribbella turkmenica]|nr:ABC transporter substrate-binding protein [Kribbella turkmenica]